MDSIQERLTNYARVLNYADLSPEAIHAAKIRVIDTIGVLLGGGFFSEPSSIVRNLAALIPQSTGATVVGTRLKTTLDMAAFVNCATARYPELTDGYLHPGSMGGHPSDVVTSLLATGEHVHSTGRELIRSIILGYEVFCRISDVFHNMGFDHSNFNCIATAVAAGTLLDLSAEQLSHCVSMAAVPNVILRQVRAGRLSMFKAAASGQAARAGVFAAMLARCGMEGPHLPFEGKAGWCNNVALERIPLDVMGGNGVPFRILDTSIKVRPIAGTMIASVLAVEKVAPIACQSVKRVVVEVYERALDRNGLDEKHWNPASREDADHSLPYVVGAALMDGSVMIRTFDESHLRSPELHALMQKIEVVENKAFSVAYKNLPMEHRSRVTVWMDSGERLIGEAGGDENDMAMSKSDTQINDKFRGLTEDLLGAKRVNAVLDLLWHLEDVRDVSVIPPLFAIV